MQIITDPIFDVISYLDLLIYFYIVLFNYIRTRESFTVQKSPKKSQKTTATV